MASSATPIHSHSRGKKARSPLSNMKTSRVLSILWLSLLVFAFETSAQTIGKAPIIIIPGITGSQLYNPRDDRNVWFSIRRDRDDDVRLPMTSPILARNRDGLKVKDIIRTI